MDIYTDGSYRAKTNKGAWAFQIGDEVISGTQEDTTNNVMELTAVMRALEYIYDNKLTNVTIYSDSEYVVKGYNTWIHNWEKNNWRTTVGMPVKNREQWERLRDLKKAAPGVAVKWVKGHANNEGNNKIDAVVQGLTADTKKDGV